MTYQVLNPVSIGMKLEIFEVDLLGYNCHIYIHNLQVEYSTKGIESSGWTTELFFLLDTVLKTYSLFTRDNFCDFNLNHQVTIVKLFGLLITADSKKTVLSSVTTLNCIHPGI
jgi:hypothetical protein